MQAQYGRSKRLKWELYSGLTDTHPHSIAIPIPILDCSEVKGFGVKYSPPDPKPPYLSQVALSSLYNNKHCFTNHHRYRYRYQTGINFDTPWSAC